jgi:hypothetical protein
LIDRVSLTVINTTFLDFNRLFTAVVLGKRFAVSRKVKNEVFLLHFEQRKCYCK